jgi:hypothetical protein
VIRTVTPQRVKPGDFIVIEGTNLSEVGTMTQIGPSLFGNGVDEPALFAGDNSLEVVELDKSGGRTLVGRVGNLPPGHRQLFVRNPAGKSNEVTIQILSQGGAPRLEHANVLASGLLLLRGADLALSKNEVEDLHVVLTPGGSVKPLQASAGSIVVRLPNTVTGKTRVKVEVPGRGGSNTLEFDRASPTPSVSTGGIVGGVSGP